MHPSLRASTASSRLLACLLIITATSCIKVTDRIIPGTSIRYDQGVSFDGPPRATLNAHPDHQGWTVSLTQPLKRHVAFIKSNDRNNIITTSIPLPSQQVLSRVHPQAGDGCGLPLLPYWLLIIKRITTKPCSTLRGRVVSWP